MGRIVKSVDFNPNKLNEKINFIGSSKDYEVYFFYQPDIEYLKSIALTLERANSLGVHTGERASRSLGDGRERLVFASSKFVDTHSLLELHMDYCQLLFKFTTENLKRS